MFLPKRAILYCLLVFFMTGCSGAHYPIAKTNLSANESFYRLQAGDSVRLRVYEEPDLSGTFKLDDQGKIALPLVGKVMISGRSEQEASNIIIAALEKGGILKRAKVALEIKEARPYFIMGEVGKAGSYPAAHGMTIYQAVAMAGGYTYRADRHDITIRRASSDGAGEQRLAATESTFVLPGDAIEVGERFF